MAGLWCNSYLELLLFLLALLKPSVQICGQRQMFQQPLIAGGSVSTPGQWPWHVALFHRESSTKTTYKCGGTIISRGAILTAFHCVVDKHRMPIENDRLIVRAGLFDVDVGGKTVQEKRVFEIISPPRANARTLKHDIAILKLYTQFTCDDYVQPVCIRSVPQDISQRVGTFGTVVGWGRTEHNAITATLRQAKLPIVGADDCLASDPYVFRLVATTNVYCAGSQNGTSSCNGDSGGGMYFRTRGHWFQHGITSFSTEDDNFRGTCNSYGYVAYTDISKYLDWMLLQGVRFEDPLKRIPESRPVSSDKSKARLRLSVDHMTKMFLQQHKGKVMLRVRLNGRKVESLFK